MLTLACFFSLFFYVSVKRKHNRTVHKQTYFFHTYTQRYSLLQCGESGCWNTLHVSVWVQQHSRWIQTVCFLFQSNISKTFRSELRKWWGGWRCSQTGWNIQKNLNLEIWQCSILELKWNKSIPLGWLN